MKWNTQFKIYIYLLLKFLVRQQFFFAIVILVSKFQWFLAQTGQYLVNISFPWMLLPIISFNEMFQTWQKAQNVAQDLIAQELTKQLIRKSSSIKTTDATVPLQTTIQSLLKLLSVLKGSLMLEKCSLFGNFQRGRAKTSSIMTYS